MISPFFFTYFKCTKLTDSLAIILLVKIWIIFPGYRHPDYQIRVKKRTLHIHGESRDHFKPSAVQPAVFLQALAELPPYRLF